VKSVLTFCFLLFTAIVFSQNQGAIRGTIADSAMNNEPMLFANVQLKGSDTSYQTNFHGNFEISDLKPGTHTLVVSYAGYQTQEIEVLVKNNEITEVYSEVSPMRINLDNVEGMDAVLKEDTPRK